MENVFANVLAGIISGVVILFVERLMFQSKEHRSEDLQSGKPASNTISKPRPTYTQPTPVKPPSPSTQTKRLASDQKNPILAAILSFIFFGGAGQIYVGQVQKGIVLIIITIIANLILFGFSLITILFTIDAYKIAKKSNAGEHVGEWEFGLNWQTIFVALLVNIVLVVLLLSASN